MKKGLLYFLVLFCLFSCQSSDDSKSPVVLKELCQRLFPQHASSFQFELLEDSLETDHFTLTSQSGKIHIQGNNYNSMAVGLNYYLKNYCHTHVSWYASDSIVMPEELPMLDKTVSCQATCDNRFFLNYCTFGYTMAYWKWQDWERLIDWMALNGVTMPLAITGQESIWYKVWTEMGLSDEEVRAYFTGPAQLPWHRMSNVDYWQSPLPKDWLVQQEALQKQILAREREFNMTPVLPAFAGHVPAELKKIYPEAKIYTMSQWGGFDEKYRSHFIDPMDSLYGVIQKRFLEEQTKIYGTDHIYGIDPFNEVDSPNWNEEFLSNVSKKIYESLSNVDPEAKWLQMTWMFYHAKEKWTPSRIKAFLRAVPQDKLILLDYYCDHTEIWKNIESYYGQPYIWCYLGNFGGNTMMVGDLNDTDMKINRVLAEGGDNVYGLGVTLEAFDVNPLMYEFVFDKAWNQTQSTDEWIGMWAKCRGGQKDKNILKAWKDLHEKIYMTPALCGQAVLINARPQFEGVQGWNTYPDYKYDNKDLWTIWSELLQATDVVNQGYDFDVVNVGRQVLGNLFSDYRAQFTACYKRKDLSGAEQWAKRMDDLILDVDRLLSCSPLFSMGKWIKDAKDCAASEDEKNYYEENARGIVTIWGQKDTQLNDYANRGWAGLTKSFYRGRWKLFTDGVLAAMKANRSFDEKKFHKDVTEFEYQWTLQHEDFPISSGESAVKVANELWNKYQNDFR